MSCSPKKANPSLLAAFCCHQFVIEHFVVEIKGDTKDNYLSKPWFVSFFDPILKWYERRYGKSAPHFSSISFHRSCSLLQLSAHLSRCAGTSRGRGKRNDLGTFSQRGASCGRSFGLARRGPTSRDNASKRREALRASSA